MTIEHELVLAADERAERDGGEVVARALGEHPLALAALARVVRRRADVDEQRRACERLFVGQPAWTWLPDVLADRQSDRQLADLDHPALGARLEVPLFVEDAVVRQVDLAVDRLDGAVGQHCARVVDIVGTLREPDQRDHAFRVAGDPLERRPGVRQEVLLEQQILRWVSRDRQLGEQDELRAGALGVVDADEGSFGVRPCKRCRPTVGVHLAEREAGGGGHVRELRVAGELRGLA